jgi:hypothetical protein
MTTAILDNLRQVFVTDNSQITKVTISETGMQGPMGAATNVNGHPGPNITLTASDVGAIASSTLNQPLGTPSLDGSALLLMAQMPLASLALNFVDLSTNQTVNGVKSFSSIPVGPASDPTTGNQLSRKAYVDTKLPLAGGVMTGAITLAADPTAPLQPATKQYVDAAISGISVKASCRCATVTALPANTYSNGAAGAGATLTATANGALGTIDGASPGVGDRVLVKNEATAANNGLYVITQAGDSTHPYILTRATDCDINTEAAGAFTFIEGGTTNAGSGWTLPIIPANLTVGTTAQNWSQFSGAGQITAGTGLTKSGNTISLVVPVAIANGGTGSTTQNFVDLTTSQTIAGNKTFSGTMTVNAAVAVNSGTATPGHQVTSTQAGGQLYRGIAADSATVSFETEVSGDTIHRWVAKADGKQEWGPGNAARDVNLYRVSAGVLKTDQALHAGAELSANDLQVNSVSIGRGLTHASISTVTNGSATSGTTETQDTVLGTLTVAGIISGRTYTVKMNGLVGNGNAGDIYFVRIRADTGTVTTSSPIVAENTWHCSTSGTGGRQGISLEHTWKPSSSGTYNFSFWAVRSVGSGVFTPLAPGGDGATIARELLVRDDGLV